MVGGWRSLFLVVILLIVNAQSAPVIRREPLVWKVLSRIFTEIKQSVEEEVNKETEVEEKLGRNEDLELEIEEIAKKTELNEILQSSDEIDDTVEDETEDIRKETKAKLTEKEAEIGEDPGYLEELIYNFTGIYISRRSIINPRMWINLMVNRIIPKIMAVARGREGLDDLADELKFAKPVCTTVNIWKTFLLGSGPQGFIGIDLKKAGDPKSGGDDDMDDDDDEGFSDISGSDDDDDGEPDEPNEYGPTDFAVTGNIVKLPPAVKYLMYIIPQLACEIMNLLDGIRVVTAATSRTAEARIQTPEAEINDISTKITAMEATLKKVDKKIKGEAHNNDIAELKTAFETLATEFKTQKTAFENFVTSFEEHASKLDG